MVVWLVGATSEKSLEATPIHPGFLFQHRPTFPLPRDLENNLGKKMNSDVRWHLAPPSVSHARWACRSEA